MPLLTLLSKTIRSRRDAGHYLTDWVTDRLIIVTFYFTDSAIVLVVCQNWAIHNPGMHLTTIKRMNLRKLSCITIWRKNVPHKRHKLKAQHNTWLGPWKHKLHYITLAQCFSGRIVYICKWLDQSEPSQHIA